MNLGPINGMNIEPMKIKTMADTNKHKPYNTHYVPIYKLLSKFIVQHPGVTGISLFGSFFWSLITKDIDEMYR